LIEHEFDSLGDYDDSIFLKKCFLDSYFHIKYECAGIRTKSLIASLIEKGVKPSNNGYTKHDFDTKLNSIILKSHKALLDNISLNRWDVIPENGIQKHQLGKYIIFNYGWWAQEDWGLWSNGKSSRFMFNSGEKKSKKLFIEGKYFNGEEKTVVYVNGIKLGAFVLTKKEIEIPTQAQKSKINLVELRHKESVSPNEPEFKNVNIRKIKFGLTGIKIG